MVALSHNETARIIRDLLRTGKVVMRGKLYDEDPHALIEVGYKPIDKIRNDLP